jgi:uncharacterized coiled-coil DUF342 family protein
MDLEEYADDELKARINHLENLVDSLRKEIRTQRKEIDQLREERKMILNQDLSPEYKTCLDLL